MKNSERFKTVQERTDAFDSFCGSRRLAVHGCDTECPCYHKDCSCHFAWLELEEKERGEEVK